VGFTQLRFNHIALSCHVSDLLFIFLHFISLKRFGFLLKHRTSLTRCFAAFSNRKSLSTFSENALSGAGLGLWLGTPGTPGINLGSPSIDLWVALHNDMPSLITSKHLRRSTPFS